MLLLYVAASCVLFGSAAGLTEEKECYGGTLTLPFDYIPVLFKGQMYFTPSSGGPRKLIMDNGEAKDPRLIVSMTAVQFRDLRDEGTFSISTDNRTLLDIIRLNILDCSDKITKYYGDTYFGSPPSGAELLEFTRLHSKDQPKVLWNRTDPQTNSGGRVRVTRNGRSWQINDLTQADIGHYSFRAKDNSWLQTTFLKVEEHVSNHIAKVDKSFLVDMKPALRGELWTVSFTPKGELSSIPLVRERRLVNKWNFQWRIQLLGLGIDIDPVKHGDSGTFEYRDQQGNLFQTVTIDVKDEEISTAGIFAIVAAAVFAVVFIGLIVKKCCCKKSSSKRDASTPPVFYHSSTQPAGPSYSAAPAPHHSYQPTNSFVPTEPTTTSLEPSVAAVGAQTTDPAPTLGSDCLSSDPGPHFEVKGLRSPSAPPLNSDSTLSDVYTSDKLNFL
ncbi:uncharacterized protein LOC131982159 [Centropristis striata]|uniref:uncharacterized protein LOC131982159 n=1 Tax=Centropristis striata TaxID=184440 RepID=UPI0027E12D7C|nr:uncharacterized protein LOC131982159 [Centropristis striata]